MQLCAVRSWGFFGRGRLAEIGRGANDREGEVRADAHGYHVFRHVLADTNAGVVALRDDVSQAIVDDDLHLDVGIGRQGLPPGQARGSPRPRARRP